MFSRSEELDQMKRLDLRVIASELGYTINHKRSSRGSAVMDHANGDRILIARATDGHYVWCSVDERGSGTCIDLWQRHRGGSLGEVRVSLRPFLNGSGLVPDKAPLYLADSHGPVLPELQPVERDILAIRARYGTFRSMKGQHPYLCEERRIPPAILALPCFAARLRIDKRGNAIFPHFNKNGLCGWEARNRGFMSFAAGGTKGLWCSVPSTHDNRLVITESAIDALSHAAMAGYERTRFVSFSGGMNTGQPALLAGAMSKMSAGSSIIIAVDNDKAGDEYCTKVEQCFTEIRRGDLRCAAERPSVRGTDWNDALRWPEPYQY